MTAEIGVFLLVLALVLALLQASYLLPRLRTTLGPCLGGASLVQALCVTLALAVLITLRLDSDFSVQNVVEHSSLSLPVLYKIAGAWGNHEGSMVLFTLVLSAFGAALASSKAPPDSKHLAVSVQAAVAAGALAFTLFTSNPFARIFPPTTDGQELNPLLQDIALAMHPPLLYLGYVGFSVVFSMAMAALIQGKCGRDWAEAAHPWILAAWSALTLGIGLGSWWAYRELGWGGWWFWDPVENASLLPWLSGTALLHANIVLKKRGLLTQWVLALSIVTFAMSLIGTFLVRSGALTSVHSFASDPERGLFILIYFSITIGGALLLFSARAHKIETEGGMVPVSREGMIVINNLFILTACATVLLGTLYPLVAEWLSGEKLSVGPPYFNATFLPLMAVPLVFAGLVPFMAWKNASFSGTLRQIQPALLASLAMLVLVLAIARTEILTAGLGFALSTWLFVASLQWVMNGRGRANTLSVFLGHVGAAVLVAGITGVSLWKQEAEKWMAPGDTLPIGGYTVAFVQQMPADGENYKAMQVTLAVSDAAGNKITALTPEYRNYAIRDISTSETSIASTPWADLYAAAGQATPDGKKRSVRVYYVPLISFIWLGFLLIAAGGITGIAGRRR